MLLRPRPWSRPACVIERSCTSDEVLPARGNTIGRYPVRRRSAVAAGPLVRTLFSSDPSPNGDAEDFLFALCVMLRAGCQGSLTTHVAAESAELRLTAKRF